MNNQQTAYYNLWRLQLDTIDCTSLLPVHKLVIAHIQVVFVSCQPVDEGYFKVVVGKLPTRNNLIGQTGLSDWTVRTVIDELVINDLLKKRIHYGTQENGYLDATLFLKPTEKWLKGYFKVAEKSKRRVKKLCPHCLHILGRGDIKFICKHCGSQFDKPLYREETE